MGNAGTSEHQNIPARALLERGDFAGHSSWIDARTLRPLRMRSGNAARVVSLEFDGRRVRGRTPPSTGTHAPMWEGLATGDSAVIRPVRSPRYRFELRLVRRISCLPSRLNRLMSIPWRTFSLASVMKSAPSTPVSIAL